jgi:hypothetical protein
LRFGNVQHADVGALTSAVQKLVQSGMPLDGMVWDHIREIMNFPEAVESDAVSVAAPDTAIPRPGAASPPAKPADVTTPAEKTPDETGAKASEECGHGHALHLAERRAPHGVECYVALDELAARFDDAKTAIAEATQGTREKLVAELATRARAAAEKGTLAKFAAGQPPMLDKLAAEIKAVLTVFYADGRKQVADEMERQADGKPVAEIVEEHAAPATDTPILAAEKPKKKPNVPPVSAADIADQAEVAARSLGAQAQAAAVAAATRLRTVPMTDEALLEAIRRETDAAAMRLSGVVTDLIRAGRADEGRDRFAGIKEAVYSAILDSNLCSVCEASEGKTTTDLDEAATWTPNPGCLGQERCRCVTIYVYETEPA